MMAIPPSGPYCPGDCMEYPFQQLFDYYPRDYIWMYLACLQLIVYVFFSVSIHFNTSAERKIFSKSGLVFATVAATVLLIDFYVQFAVVPVSALKGESDGIALLTQYNGNGIFIAMEELGYILMSIAFLFQGLSFINNKGLERTIKWLLSAPIILMFISFIFYSIQYGIERSYRFEVAAVTIDWLALIVIGIFMSVYFKKKLNSV